MCALFGRELITYDVPLRIRASGAVGGVPPFEVAAWRAAPIGTTALHADPGFAPPAVHALALPATPVAVRRRVPERVDPPAHVYDLGWPPVKAALRLPALPPFVAPIRQEGTVPAPAVREALDAARAQLVRKRLVPAELLAPADAAGWVRRLADSKKMAKTRLALVGVFPDVPVTEGTPVRYDAGAGAIAFPAPEAAVPLSTVVVARRTDTGAAVIGRFYR